MLTMKQKLEALAGLGIELNRVADLDLLMEKVLTEARRFVNADAGSIYIKDKNQLRFAYTQNATLEKKLAKGEKLIYSTFTMPIDTQSIAGYAAVTGQELNIPDVYQLDEELPYKFSRQFDITTAYRTKSVLALPLKTNRQEIFL